MFKFVFIEHYLSILGVIYKKVGFYLESVWLWKIKWGLIAGGGEVGFGGYW